MRFILCLLALLLIPIFVIHAQEATPEATPELSGTVAWIRFVHVSVDTPNIDFYLDGEIISEDLPFLNITPYFGIPAGTHEIALVPTGQDIGTALQKRSGRLASGHTYTIGASGFQESGSFLMFVLDETSMMQNAFDSAPQMGEPDTLARFIVLHAIENGSPLSVVLQTGETIVPSLEFGAYYVSPVIPGTYPIMVITTDGESVVFNQMNPLEIRSGLLYFVIMTGTADDPQILVSVTGTKTIEEILRSSDTVKNFADALESVGLMETLATEGLFTVFVPTNGALEAAGELDEAALQSHIVLGVYRLNEIVEQDTLTTLSGGEIMVGNAADDNSQLSILLNDVPLEFSGVLGINGIVYLINAVLTE
jgi:uncharacterized surface protein with fasciclin (FAS1) repeats